uniref:Uncharacterized protein n=1 Tax=Pseudochlorodesmis sp. HV01306c TaxID=2358490 RepID=A0A386AYH4_9CHLO|nr:hypothetical protein [Pseudochlorodesmis sp. HV01306c]
MESGFHNRIVEFVSKNLEYRPGFTIYAGATLRVREQLDALKVRTIYRAFLKFMGEFYPKQTPENPNTFRKKLDTVFQYLEWMTANPPVTPGRTRFNGVLATGETKSVRQRSYLNIAWKNGGGQLKLNSSGGAQYIDEAESTTPNLINSDFVIKSF